MVASLDRKRLGGSINQPLTRFRCPAQTPAHALNSETIRAPKPSASPETLFNPHRSHPASPRTPHTPAPSFLSPYRKRLGSHSEAHLNVFRRGVSDQG